MFALTDFIPVGDRFKADRVARFFLCGALSLTALAVAVLFVGLGYLFNLGDDKNALAKVGNTGSGGVVILSHTTRDVFAILGGRTQTPDKTDVPLIIASNNEQNGLTDPMPRLKPPAPQPVRSIAKSINMNGTWLAESEFYSFAHNRDFTGGRESIFTKYVSPFTDPEDISAADSVTLKRGESLYAALVRAGIHPDDSEAAVAALSDLIRVRTLRAGTTFTITRTASARTEFQEMAHVHGSDALAQDRLNSLMLADDPVRRVFVRQDSHGTFYAETEVAETSMHYAAISGEITDSLFASAERAGVPREIVAKLANMFVYDVDFQRQIRRGDRFEAVYEVFYDELGRIAGYGDIVFGRMSWLNRTKERGYYRYRDEGKIAWFDFGGKSAKRLLMKTPIDGARITSGFGMRRHPISGYSKRHKGTDFGARSGTPIMAAGDGVIERANRFGSYGNYVRIRHANGYKTAYAHLKGFARGIKSGTQVRQGQIIGYVGSTGASTGPHLHYEVLRNNKQINPMTIKVATGKELDAVEMASFATERDWIEDLRQPQQLLVLAQN
ncbi:M23 family metallopeptidase [Parvularcula sp. IMCC14364]|uniref:M23 family metallopeptidase n=1 Tax=Parvularcula sp. IMCC14364 TaxID=3067902 RepID=UPI002741A7F9|nr:M23 family metallopeptidase [Parvularcula sp. IMCC14364]